MPLHPPPIVDSSLCLLTQRLPSSDASQVAEITCAFHSANAPSASDAVNCATAWQVAFTTRFGPHLDSAFLIDQAVVREGQGSTVLFEGVAAGSATFGGASNALPPPQVAALFKKTTAFTGKANRGRMYIPGVLDMGHVSEGGQLDAAEQLTLNTAATNLLGDMNTAGYQMVIANKVLAVDLSGKKYVTEIHTGAAVLTFQVEPLVATQRRRLRG